LNALRHHDSAFFDHRFSYSRSEDRREPAASEALCCRPIPNDTPGERSLLISFASHWLEVRIGSAILRMRMNLKKQVKIPISIRTVLGAAALLALVAQGVSQTPNANVVTNDPRCRKSTRMRR
jgi:hypothetical protein